MLIVMNKHTLAWMDMVQHPKPMLPPHIRPAMYYTVHVVPYAFETDYLLISDFSVLAIMILYYEGPTVRIGDDCNHIFSCASRYIIIHNRSWFANSTGISLHNYIHMLHTVLFVCFIAFSAKSVSFPMNLSH